MTNATTGKGWDMSGPNAEMIAEMRAAIDTLTAERDASTPAPWAYGGNGYVETVPEFDLNRFDVMSETVFRAGLLNEDSKLIVTLHRTIEAMLCILRGEVNFCQINGYSPQTNKLDLARAINGATK